MNLIGKYRYHNRYRSRSVLSSPSTLPSPHCPLLRHEALLAMVPENYVADLEAKGDDLTLAEIKTEIKKHSAELEALMEALPAQVRESKPVWPGIWSCITL